MEIALQCPVHPEEKAYGLCMAAQCEQVSRLVCFECITGDHGEHNMDTIRFSDLKKANIFELTNWPKDDLFLGMKKMVQVNDLSSAHQLIDKWFDTVRDKLMTDLQAMRESCKAKIEKSMDFSKSPQLDLLKENFLQVYDIGQIQQAVTKYQGQQVSKTEFQYELNDYLKSTSDPQVTNNLSKLVEQFGEVALMTVNYDDSMHLFQDMQKLVLQIPSELVCEGSFGNGFQMIPSPTTKHNVDISGQNMKFKAGYTNTYSSETLDKGVWEWEVEVRTQMTGCCLFGLIPENQVDQVQSFFGSNPYHCFSNGCSAFGTVSGGASMETQYKIGQILQFQIDCQQNIYSYGWKDSQAVHNLSGNYTLNNKKLRFYINSYGVTACEFNLVQVIKQN